MVAERFPLCKPLQSAAPRPPPARRPRRPPHRPVALRRTRARCRSSAPTATCDPWILAKDTPIGDPALELVTRDHYLLRMVYSQGVAMEALGVRPLGEAVGRGGRPVGLADLRRALPPVPRHAVEAVARPHALRGVRDRASASAPDTADAIYDELAADARPGRLPAPGAVRSLRHRVPRYDRRRARPARGARRDPGLGVGTGGSCRRSGPTTWSIPTAPGFLRNLERARRPHRRGHDVVVGLPGRAPRPSRRLRRGRRDGVRPRPPDAADRRPRTRRRPRRCSLGSSAGRADAGDAELLPGPDARRDGGDEPRRRPRAPAPRRVVARHNPTLTARFGSDKGADIPKPMDYVGALKPLLDRFGNEPALTVVVYTLDESTYSRELAPARRPLPGAAARTAVVVPRQPRGHPPVPPAGHRDRRLRQHRRLQRRRPLAAHDPGPSRRRPADRRRLPRRSRRRAPARGGRGGRGRRRPRLPPRPRRVPGRR